VTVSRIDHFCVWLSLTAGIAWLKYGSFIYWWVQDCCGHCMHCHPKAAGTCTKAMIMMRSVHRYLRAVSGSHVHLVCLLCTGSSQGLQPDAQD
jgi:hypothetical protein